MSEADAGTAPTAAIFGVSLHQSRLACDAKACEGETRDN